MGQRQDKLRFRFHTGEARDFARRNSAQTLSSLDQRVTQ